MLVCSSAMRHSTRSRYRKFEITVFKNRTCILIFQWKKNRGLNFRDTDSYSYNGGAGNFVHIPVKFLICLFKSSGSRFESRIARKKTTLNNQKMWEKGNESQVSKNSDLVYEIRSSYKMIQSRNGRFHIFHTKKLWHGPHLTAMTLLPDEVCCKVVLVLSVGPNGSTVPRFTYSCFFWLLHYWKLLTT
jgi:hypothetical protein